MINVSIDTQQIIADLNALSDDLKNQAVKLGIAKVAATGLLDLKQETPVGDTGDVQKSLTKRNLTQRQYSNMALSDGTVAMLVGPNRKVRGKFQSRIFNVLDTGARPHIIKPGKSTLKLEFMYAQGMRRKADILYDSKTKKFFGKEVHHPGTRSLNMLSAADSALSSQAESIFFTTVQQFLDRRRS